MYELTLVAGARGDSAEVGPFPLRMPLFMAATRRQRLFAGRRLLRFAQDIQVELPLVCAESRILLDRNRAVVSRLTFSSTKGSFAYYSVGRFPAPGMI